MKLLLALVAMFLLPALVLALGADHPAGALPGQPHWPAGLVGLVNAKQRVHGFWVNAEEKFFYRGDTTALNDFLAQYAKLKDTKLVLVLHPGGGEVRSPWDKTSRGPADWTLYFCPRDWLLHAPGGSVQKTDPTTISRVDVWLGGSVRLTDLTVPENVTVESGGEIEGFIRKHQGKGQP
jgi:hypothetical protein